MTDASSADAPPASGSRLRAVRRTLGAVARAGVGTACGGASTTATSPASPISSTDRTAAEERVDAISAAVSRWEAATDLPAARAAAEEARNLVTGPGVLGAGDLDHNGTIDGSATTGLLPGDDGGAGLATPLGTCALVERDVLGGPWLDPAGRWATVAAAITGWTSSNNTFPSLASHPQRVVGWATLTLSATALATAHEDAGHARLHVAVTQDALAACT
ncbi:MAG: hypothetical protein ACT4OV_09350 [Microthrixaceae bacterium]